MYKQYPYLQDSYIYQTDVEREKRNILAQIDSFINQRQYVKITLLDWDEEPIKAIEGEITSGSISKVGDSPIRRTAQLTCAVDARSYSVDDGKADFAINKKVFIEIGVKNETPHYPDYPIFWFPEGVFFIGSFSINAGANASTTITLSLKDKMAILNGDVGGTLPATVIFDTMDTQLPNGEYIEKKVLIYNIIQELVHHYGGEDLNKIVIEGVPLRIRRIMQWVGDTPLYQYTKDYNEEHQRIELFDFSTEELASKQWINKYEKGSDVGYIMDDFVITDELTGAPGESVTSILDKIKNILGNYEYFYDIFGTFHFREIKNYYVTTQARTLLDEMSENDYLVEVNNSRSIYTFDDEKLLTSINVNPQYENIKNDYIIEGQTGIVDSDITIPIRYHLAIDAKPPILGTDNREKIRKLIDNSIEITEKQEELKQLEKASINNIDTLEELLYNIRNAKMYIDNKNNLIDVKDKELLKQLQDIWKTTYTYEELKDNSIVFQNDKYTSLWQESQLLSERWLIKYIDQYNQIYSDNMIDITKNIVSLNLTQLLNNYDAVIPVENNSLSLININLQSKNADTRFTSDVPIQNIIVQLNSENDILSLDGNAFFTLTYNILSYFISLATLPDIANIETQIDDIENQIAETPMGISLQEYIDNMNSIDINSIDWTSTDLTDIEKKIYIYDKNNVAENEQLYNITLEALKEAYNQQDILQTQLKILNEQLNQAKERYTSIRNSLIVLYNFILQLQQQRDAKIKELDGDNTTSQIGIENNHECLISGTNIQWFSHNTDKISIIDDNVIIDNNKYSFISNDILLTVTLNQDNNYPFYQGSLFDQFYQAFIGYYNNTTEDALLNQIEILKAEISDLEQKNNTFQNDYTNPNRYRKFYDVYPTENREMILYTHPRNNVVCAGYVEEVSELPNVGNFNLIYKNHDIYMYWDGKIYQTIVPLEIYNNTNNENQYYAYDWRTKLYLDGLKGVINGTDKGYYYEELSAFWPQVYNLQTQRFFAEEKDRSIDYKTLAVAGTYYLDFLDEVDTSFGEWSVNNIGRRSDVIVKEEVNCLFQPEIPNVILLPNNNVDLKTIGHSMKDETYRYGSSLESSLTLEELRAEAIANFYPYSQVSSEIYNNLLTGGYRNGAFDQIKYELYLHTRYQKSISLTSIPVFYLEPNNRITINDTTTNTYGDFVIQSINITLGPGANMSITCNETAERF